MKILKNFFGKLITNFRLVMKAKSDFLSARGRYHLKLMRKILPKVKKDLEKKSKEINEVKKNIEEILKEREKELKREAALVLIQNLENEVKGIGPKMKERIIKFCFRESIEDLKNAYLFIKGVGREKQFLINKWIAKQMPIFQSMIFGEADFPVKREIFKKYEIKIQNLQKNLNKVNKEMKEMETLKIRLENEIEKFQKIKLIDFIKAYYRKDLSTSQKVKDYLIGVFPEWDSVPNWFKKLIKKYGNR